MRHRSIGGGGGGKGGSWAAAAAAAADADAAAEGESAGPAGPAGGGAHAGGGATAAAGATRPWLSADRSAAMGGGEVSESEDAPRSARAAADEAAELDAVCRRGGGARGCVTRVGRDAARTVRRYEDR